MHVFLIALDTLRADHLSCYGYPRETSPAMDALAADGVLFENYVTCAGHTTPSFTSVVSGQEPFHHGIVATLHAITNDRDSILDDLTPTLADIMTQEGYVCTAFDNQLSFRSRPGWFARGFRHYVNLTPVVSSVTSLLAGGMNAELLPWLERANFDQDQFFFIHYWDPHRPYNQPDEYRNRFDRSLKDLPTIKLASGEDYVVGAGKADMLSDDRRNEVCLYDEEIWYTDDHLKEVFDTLARLGIYDESLIIVFADHGEDMYEHNCFLGHRELYEPVIRVPLIVKPPKGAVNFTPGNRAKGMATHYDLMPTILDFAGVQYRRGHYLFQAPGRILDLDGFSLIPLITGEAESVRGALVSTGCYFRHEGRYKSVEVGVRTETRKLVVRRRVPPGNYEMSQLAGLLHFDRGMDYRVFNSLPDVELLDYVNDVAELTNLAPEEPDTVESLMQALAPILVSPYMFNG